MEATFLSCPRMKFPEHKKYQAMCPIFFGSQSQPFVEPARFDCRPPPHRLSVQCLVESTSPTTPDVSKIFPCLLSRCSSQSRSSQRGNRAAKDSSRSRPLLPTTWPQEQ